MATNLINSLCEMVIFVLILYDITLLVHSECKRQRKRTAFQMANAYCVTSINNKKRVCKFMKLTKTLECLKRLIFYINGKHMLQVKAMYKS